MKPGVPAGYSQTQEDHNKLARRRSVDGERAQPAAIGFRSQRRGQKDITLAVKTACGPRRSKRTPLSKGLSPSTHGTPSGPWVPRANVLVGDPLSPPRLYLDEHGKLLRWNGCGCWEVLRWYPHISHQRRGPRSGQLYCFKMTPAASASAAPS